MSVIQDYIRERVPPQQWTMPVWNEYQEILRRLAALDAKLGQPDCEDPAKAAWMREIENRLQKLEGGEPKAAVGTFGLTGGLSVAPPGGPAQ